MAHRSIHPPPQPMPVKPRRIKLETQMPIHVIQKAQHKEYRQMPVRHRNGKKKDDKDQALHKCLQRVKRIGRPRTRVHRPVMHQVEPPEQSRVMDQPVRPVKISVVDQEHQRKGGKKIYPPMPGNRRIIGRMHTQVRTLQQEQRREREDQDGQGGKKYLPAVVLSPWNFWLYLFPPDPAPQDHIKDQERRTRDHIIPLGNIQHRAKKAPPVHTQDLISKLLYSPLRSNTYMHRLKYIRLFFCLSSLACKDGISCDQPGLYE